MVTGVAGSRDKVYIVSAPGQYFVSYVPIIPSSKGNMLHEDFHWAEMHGLV
jgi:hypothetical protein